MEITWDGPRCALLSATVHKYTPLCCGTCSGIFDWRNLYKELFRMDVFQQGMRKGLSRWSPVQLLALTLSGRVQIIKHMVLFLAKITTTLGYGSKSPTDVTISR